MTARLQEAGGVGLLGLDGRCALKRGGHWDWGDERELDRLKAGR
jgi:hypothetical protein